MGTTIISSQRRWRIVFKAVMCNLVESNSNCLILLANYNDEILDCSIIPITNSMVIGDFSSSGLKSLSYSHVEPDCNEKNTDNRTMLTFKSSPEFWWYFRNELLRSYTYRSNVWKNFNHTESAPCAILVNIHLSRAPKCVIDYKFGTEVQLLVNEKIEMDHVMSCLSTLGGAFSSLGDQFLDCVTLASYYYIYYWNLIVFYLYFPG